jgi:hypothetical protein
MIFSLFFLFFHLTPAVQAQDILPLFRDHSIVYYGEEHYTIEHHQPLLEALEKGVSLGTISTFATEYVPANAQQKFMEYLTSPTSIKDSLEETTFFNHLEIDLRLMWPKSERNRDFYRRLRRLKQLHGEKIKFCGVDYQNPIEIRNDWDNDQDRAGLRLQEHTRRVYESLPPLILAKILEISEKNLDQLVVTDDQYYREGSMAASLKNCVGDSKGVLVHSGMFHNHRASAPTNGWWTMSQLYSLLSPVSYVTIANLRQVAVTDPLDLEDPLTKALLNIQLSRGEISPVLVSTDALSVESTELWKIVSEGETLNLTQLWDYFILGPPGSMDESLR